MANSNAKELVEKMKELREKQKTEMYSLEEQHEEAVKKERYDEAAVELHNMYQSYIDAGFTAEQAWELTTIALTNATKRTLL